MQEILFFDLPCFYGFSSAKLTGVVVDHASKVTISYGTSWAANGQVGTTSSETDSYILEAATKPTNESSLMHTAGKQIRIPTYTGLLELYKEKCH
ncbi:hypothetical protein [Neptunitalea chrysea]|nr:hypothetical protein [Neptunitalea chrysea]